MLSAMDEHYKKMNDDTEQPQVDLRVSQIRQFFSGKSIFLTGATGFMGKCFVEKILRDCEDIKKLYILVRPSKNATAEEKIQKYFRDTTFIRLRSENPNYRDKVVIIKGDLQTDGLGISDEDRQLLINETSIIVHNGATVKFSEAVNVSLTINVLATKQMLDLAMECKHMQAFVYVSTAYSHCYNLKIEEKFYDSPGDIKLVQDMIKADKATPYNLTESSVKMMLGNFPNIYIFSKAIAEGLVRQYGQKAKFPCAVFRPSMVTTSCEEPLPGWLGNFNGPAFAFWGTAMGAVHAFVNKGCAIDLIPVDTSINALIGVIYHLPKRWETEKSPVVYNCASTVANPTNLNDYYTYLDRGAHEIGSVQTVWHYFFIMTRHEWLFYILHFLLHFLPACLVDLVLICIGQKPKALKLFKLAHANLPAMIYFMNTNFQIHVEKTLEIYDSLSAADQIIFNFDIRKIDWEENLYKYMRYVRVYIMNEPLDNLPQARKHVRNMKILHYTVTTVLFLYLSYLALRMFNFIV